MADEGNVPDEESGRLNSRQHKTDSKKNRQQNGIDHQKRKLEFHDRIRNGYRLKERHHTQHKKDVENIVILDNLSTQRYCSLFNLDIPEGTGFQKKVKFLEGDINSPEDVLNMDDMTQEKLIRSICGSSPL